MTTPKHAADELAEAISDLEKIVCVGPPDDGVVLLSDEGTTHYDKEAKVQVYDHEHFSPLGDALIALHKKLTDVARYDREKPVERVKELEAEVEWLRGVLEKIAKPALGGKTQQGIARAALEHATGST